jgi:hypothetical protein
MRANGFRTYIVSGGGADFMRVFSQRVYGYRCEALRPFASGGQTVDKVR